MKTTIVGGRPQGHSGPGASVPRGIEVLVKKASVDPHFREILLERRANAASEIGLELDPAEVALLDSIPSAQLEITIANTKVSDSAKPAFVGWTAVAMLAVLGAATVCGPTGCTSKGEQPDIPEGASYPSTKSKSSGENDEPPIQPKRVDERADQG